MKILWLSHFIPYPPKGGILQRGYHLLKQTAKEHDVYLLAFNQENLMRPLFKTIESGLNESKTQLQKFCKTVNFISIPNEKNKLTKTSIAIKSLFTKYPYTLNWLLSKEFEESIQKHLNTTNFDFIHFDTISLAPYKHLCKSIPSSLDHHNIESHMMYRRSKNNKNILKKLYFYLEALKIEKYEKFYCSDFSFNYTCSDIDTERLIAISPKSKIHTIPNGVDISYFSPKPIMQKQNRLIFAGTLSWYPNIEAVKFIADKLWTKLKQEIPDLQIDIIGANPPQELIELSKKDPSFHVHGFVDDIRPYFRHAKCYICPITDGGGTKLKIIDALAMGMAIVANKIACEGIDVSNNKNVIFALNPDEYVLAVKSVIKNENLRTKMEVKARNLASSKYSFDFIGEKLRTYYSDYAKV